MTLLRFALLSVLPLALGCEAIASFDRDKLDPMTTPSVVIPSRDGGIRPGDAGADGAADDAEVGDAEQPQPDAEVPQEGGADAALDDAGSDAESPDAEVDGSAELDAGDDAGEDAGDAA